MRWGMVINLSRCTRCHACVAACRIEHFLPLRITWPRLIAWEKETGYGPGSNHRTGALQSVQRSSLRGGLSGQSHHQTSGRNRVGRPEQMRGLPLLRHRLSLPEPHLPFQRQKPRLFPRASQDQL